MYKSNELKGVDRKAMWYRESQLKNYRENTV